MNLCRLFAESDSFVRVCCHGFQCRRLRSRLDQSLGLLGQSIDDDLRLCLSLLWFFDLIAVDEFALVLDSRSMLFECLAFCCCVSCMCLAFASPRPRGCISVAHLLLPFFDSLRSSQRDFFPLSSFSGFIDFMCSCILNSFRSCRFFLLPLLRRRVLSAVVCSALSSTNTSSMMEDRNSRFDLFYLSSVSVLLLTCSDHALFTSVSILFAAVLAASVFFYVGCCACCVVVGRHVSVGYRALMLNLRCVLLFRTWLRCTVASSERNDGSRKETVCRQKRFLQLGASCHLAQAKRVSIVRACRVCRWL